MVSLLDVNVLVALFDPQHVHHDLAHGWFAAHRAEGWATCPVTENGFVRLISNPSYPGACMAAEAAERLERFTRSGGHILWPADLSIRDRSLFDLRRIRGHRQLTDVYLLGLAVKNQGRLATLDRRIPLAAVREALADNLALVSE